jgi:two-component system, cell cycle sensor histidine kinase and response regulator CckA
MQPAPDANPDTQRDQALRHVGELAANLAHDWNNWLTLLSAQFAELRLSSPDSFPDRLADIELTLATAGEASRRLLELLRGAGQSAMTTAAGFPIRHWEPALRLFLGPSIRLELLDDPHPPSFLLDAPLFARTLFNLAANSKAAMPAGGNFVVRTFNQDGAPALFIADTGCGFDESQKDRLLESFYSTKSNSGGTGLGLRTLREFLEVHRASLQVQSAPGRGAEFQIFFPAP